MKPIKFKTNFPTVWGDLAYQNQMLRAFSMLALLVTIMSISVTFMLVGRKPTIVTLDSQANLIPPTGQVAIELEAEKAARRYLDLRYTWLPSNQSTALTAAKNFVAPQSMKAFEKTVADLVAFSKGKNVGQRVYPTSVAVDAKDDRIKISADRFTEIQGLKAATYLRVNLIYQTGPRTIANPWGIYVVKEEEVQ